MTSLMFQPSCLPVPDLHFVPRLAASYPHETDAGSGLVSPMGSKTHALKAANLWAGFRSVESVQCIQNLSLTPFLCSGRGEEGGGLGAGRKSLRA